MARAVDRVYAHIRDSIVSGTYAPGARLGEVEIAELTETSRTPVREALRQLEMEGLVEVLPHRGARVYQWTADDLEEIYDLRMTLEAMAAARAASRIGEKDVDRLAELCDLMETAAADGADQRLDLMAQLNDEFHAIVRTAAASTRLISMLGAVIQLPLVMRTFHRYAPVDLARSHAHHRDLVAALRAGDETWADSVMRAHVRAAKHVLLQALTTDETKESS
ncbi:GntR family transcriptional regulator [Rhodococcus sp. BP-349]|uniref:GntR family transcriptional regulator n=1 Tax=unclassified Rhodococcus (in: high G+C Gram-positive bacteria) TaxID=192944 RepID=UPI001C9B0844|nr:MULTISPECIES: GntR family transcriptional regulator [unclassified Rhodococcus (in: high G+C Gram-positive bacteria)]MBY6537312.1 GntR family transcriptional regulator [Rhodococcus sp. BP-363]MBY6541649.1 GntR family transcriptional regulator [Rhodococcus sp. BP-369]MBY6560879.1 GntR family transcriptional regulator [Rhodococcus sp. BP-370]MBY6575171.1 GntR family transcriptional regulator [Rhodococcus sp. BP-364]MBY6584472.1 GntR family transcriptional regulator [Rhodococcus sp. BP-358]